MASNDDAPPETETLEGSGINHDLVGGPFAVIESDPGVFTTLIRRLGVTGIEVEEVYDIQPWALDHLKPKGLILCFMWRHDTHRAGDFEDSAAERVWFANQLSEDACASQAILNVLFNCPDVELGDALSRFKADTAKMSSMDKGLAIPNLPLLREAQNSMARPADVRGALNAIAEVTQAATKSASKPAQKKRRTGTGTGTSPAKEPKPKKNGTSAAAAAKGKTKKSKAAVDDEDENETYHFIGYVPAHGKVWELDGLKSGPLEVGELPSSTNPDRSLRSTSTSTATSTSTSSTEGWEDVVRPALRMKMEKYGGGDGESGNIRFNLLALVDDRYEARSDVLEGLKRERAALERRLAGAFPGGWRDKVNPDLLSGVDASFTTPVQGPAPGPTFAKDFGARKMERDMAILNMDPPALLRAWEACVTGAIPAKIAVEEEVQKAMLAKSDDVKRTHDYEPFIREFLTALHEEGLLQHLLPEKTAKKAQGRKEKVKKT
ncbi:cysteine proteinase [Rickenella mellea]|uniref:ubiquitinyl hydrolase 1 n=1 Tax=Rickenella mellea TaxID=50990 RepID=A0A4Y7PNR9_9AGAM|nr:cysteine proteinase [Rickenella mellea]